jgi:replicative DNA helicase
MQMPHSLESERYVIGSIMRDNRKMDEVTSLEYDEMHLGTHQEAYKAILLLHSKNLPIDPVTVSDAMLCDSGKEESLSYLKELRAEDYTTAKIAYHAKIIKRDAVRRKVIYAAREIIAEAEEPVNHDEFLDVVEQRILGIREKHFENETKPASYYIKQLKSSIEMRETVSVYGVTSGIPKIDEVLTFCPGHLIVIAARPGGGKSISGIQFAVHAVDNGHPTAVYSLEMQGEELVGRAVSLKGNVDSAYVNLKRTVADKDEADRFAEASSSVSQMKMYINDRPWNSIQKILSNIRMMHRKHGIKMVVIDYLQLIQSPKQKGEMRYQQLGEITQALKNIAKDLKIPVIVLAQLGRDAKEEPEIWHLKESGSTEQDADVVMLMWQEMLGENMPSDIVNIKIAKNRHGMKDVIVKVRHAKQYMRFDPLENY